MNHAHEEVSVVIHEPTLQAIFDECDRHGYAETGGRLVGTYRTEPANRLLLTVSGMIEPGPNAARTPTSLFQDGEHQEQVFRCLELEHPELEHLGNWHSHHVNGYPTLSQGDKKTYHRTVNHPHHNTDFFYAILVTKKNPRRSKTRYTVKHFVLFRGQPGELELSPYQVEIVPRPIIWPNPLNSLESVRVPNDQCVPRFRTEYDESVNEGDVALKSLRANPLDRNSGDKSIRSVNESHTGNRDIQSQDTSVSQSTMVPMSKFLSAGSIHIKEQYSSRVSTTVRMDGGLDQKIFLPRNARTTSQGSHQQDAKSSMSIVTLYVGQGSLAIVRNFESAIIIDSHLPPPDNELRKRTEQILERLLGGRDAVGFVLTGFDADHNSPGGVESILSKYSPQWIMYPKYYKDTDTASEVFRIIASHERKRRLTRKPLRRLSVRVDTVDSRFLADLSDRFDFELFSPHFQDMDNSNNSSIVLKISGKGEGAFSYLVTGDTENDRWNHINQIFGTSLESDVLAAPHHGSKNAVHPGSLLSINPDTVLISAGVDNQYGHPDPQAVGVYQHIAGQVYSTNVEGGVSLYTNRKRGCFHTQLTR